MNATPNLRCHLSDNDSDTAAKGERLASTDKSLQNYLSSFSIFAARSGTTVIR
jgi:hypothetical protein